MLAWFLEIVTLIFCWRLLRFITTPFLKGLGFYKYYSTHFMILPWFFGTFDFHLGTSWDFLKADNISSKQILISICEGLINMSKDIENGKIKKSARFKGNTYYFRPQTVKQFGFKTRKMNIFETFLFILNYLELCLLNSIAKKRFVLVSLKNVMVVTCGTDEILNNKNRFEAILLRLKGGGIRQYGRLKLSSPKQVTSYKNTKNNSKNDGVKKI